MDRFMDTLLRDLRYALRSLARSPVFTTVAVLTLALGIGANATIFSLVNAVMLRPPAQVRAPDRLVWIYTSDYSGPAYSASSYRDYEVFAGETGTLSGAAAFAPRPVNLVEGGQTTRLLAELVSVNYFDVLGVRPAPGRAFQPDDGTGVQPVAIISQGLWRDRFAADPGIIGRAVHLNGGTFTVVGVAPSGYQGAIRGLRVDVGVSFQAQPLLAGGQDFIGQRGNRGLLVIGRLRSGTSVAQAQARFNVVAAQLYHAYPDNWRDVHQRGRRIMHIPLLRGRAFTPQDRPGAPNVAIVNEAFAQRFWPGEDPIGKRLTYFHRLQDLEVVGVVPTGKYTSLGEQPTPFIYAPFLQDPRSMEVHVRTTGDPARLIALVRREIHSVDPSLPIPTLATMPSLMAVSLLPQRMGASVLSLFAGLATLLAVVGLYGVIAYGVSRRTREIGIRMALGADRGSVIAMVVRRGLALTLAGMVLGLGLAGALSRVAVRFLFGIGPLDPVAFGAVTLLLFSAALLASWLPARRASRVDPVGALRCE
jgi:MacB-like periplasmic core domain/FtsX-like permease family